MININIKYHPYMESKSKSHKCQLLDSKYNFFTLKVFNQILWLNLIN